jgi:DhnA family fructose-bisphosphate aldolase class Ia
MAGGAAGMAMGRVVFEDPDPAEMAALVAAIVHGP